MRPSKKYVPCVRWKQGEYLAMMDLSAETKDSIMPLIEVAEFNPENPEYAFDFETNKPPKTIDQHLAQFAKRVRSKWGTANCFVDLCHVGVSARMVDGQHPVAFIFDALRSESVMAIPAIGLLQDAAHQDAVRNVDLADHRGLCLRIVLEEITEPNFTDQLNDLLRNMGMKSEQCDFILDLRAPPNFEPLNGFTGLLESVIKTLPHLNSWRSLSLLGTSIPKSLGGFTPGVSVIPRYEWRLYKQLAARLKSSNVRIPNFGDYVINHPEVAHMDPRFMKPRANIRYTINDSWLIARGEKTRDYSEHKDLCRSIIKSQFYSGRSFSAGDTYILDCEKGNVSTGNLTTWRRMGTNHHLEMVALDVANLSVS